MKMKYILVDRQQQTSHLNGGYMWRLKFYCINDGAMYEMTVDSAYNNFKKCHWDVIVGEDNPFGCYTNLKRIDKVTSDGVGVLTADSRAELLVRVDSQAEAVALAELDQSERRRKNKFGDLFYA
jgi:hypothetical protein